MRWEHVSTCVGIDTDSHVRRGSKQRVAMGILTSMTSGHNTKVGDEMKVTRMTNMDYGKKRTRMVIKVRAINAATVTKETGVVKMTNIPWKKHGLPKCQRLKKNNVVVETVDKVKLLWPPWPGSDGK